MPKFQENKPHPDTVKKHPLTVGDLVFLSQLQHVLNTQDGMGNAAPRFWVIAQDEFRPCPADAGGSPVVMDVDGDIVAKDLQQLSVYLDEGNVDNVDACAYFNGSVKIKFKAPKKETVGAYSVEEAVEHVLARCGTILQLQYMEKYTKIIQDTLFLTHEDCQQHLRDYGYSYNDSARAYAMTAIRSPRFEQLLKIIQETDWTAFTAGNIIAGSEDA